MEVYGDTEYEREVERLPREVAARARRCALDLDSLRSLLITAGQAEQGAEDALPDVLPPEEAGRWTGEFRAATDAFARAFLARWNNGECPAPGWAERARAALADGARTLENVGPAPAASLTLKAPEGFAYYALYPEQYARAARRWAAGRERGPVVVAGVRSVGTTLSALVAATLEADGWEVRRFTARPSGDAFRRKAEIPAGALRGAAWGIVADEGPGISGSSMTSVELAIQGAGLAPDRIAFLSGHGHGPGAAASDEVRAVWEQTAVFAAGANPPRWDGLDLVDWLAHAASKSADVVEVRDLGGGAWRDVLYHRARLWPAMATRFERAKYRVTLAGGASVLWKFAGLADRPDGSGPAFRAEAATLAARASRGWTLAPVAAAHGFVALPWVEGRPLRRADGSRHVAEQIGCYVAEAAGPPLPEAAGKASMDRLCRMLSVNLSEGVSGEAARRAGEWAARIHAATPLMPSAGDGRLAPHEWRCHAGRLLKLDAAPHDMTHTIVGSQPVAWDLAAAQVEWGFHGARAEALLTGYDAAGGPRIPADTLAFYRLAWAAHRMGETSMHAWLCEDGSADERRYRRSEARYRRLIVRLLSR